MSLLGKVLNKPPVPYVSTRGGSLFGGGGSSASSMVDRMNAMGAGGTLFSIVTRLADETASTEWHLYRKPSGAERVADEDREEVTSHAAVDLWNKPNPFYTTHSLVETCQQHLDLVGEAYIIVVAMGGLPIELWPVRPDRMSPLPHATKYLAGYEYRTPDGEKIPLGTDQVIQLKYPNPVDPYRGMGPVQAILHDLDADRYSALWNRNFFLNSAEPGGVIEVDRRLSDDEFNELRMRWNEQHRGVNNAHRAAILEHGKYVPRAFSMRDMQFAELRHVSRDKIMEAYAMSKPMLGISEDVNRAAAEAGLFQFGRHLAVPRLRRWKRAINSHLLPLFGTTGKGVEWDFDSPIDEDGESVNAERDSKVAAVVAMVNAGFDAAATLEAFDMPDIPYEKPMQPGFDKDGNPLPKPGDPNDPNADPNADPAKKDDPKKAPAKKDAPKPPANSGCQNPTHWIMVNGERVDLPALGCAECHGVRNADDVDLSDFEIEYDRALERLMDRWGDITAEQRAELRHQVREAIEADDLPALARLTVDATQGGTALTEAMQAFAALAAAQVAAEAASAGVAVSATTPVGLETTAATVAALLAAELALSGGGEALRLALTGASADDVASQVDAFLRERSNSARTATQLGAALHGAGSRGRIETFRAAGSDDDGPVGSIYATETLDSNTCEFCRAIDGRFICTTEDLAPLDKLYTAFGGYVSCKGGIRCRGTVTGVWRPAKGRR